MKPEHEIYLLFVLVLAAMLTGGLILQSWDLHGGLIGTEVLCVLLPALAYRFGRGREINLDWPSFRRLGMPPVWLLWVGLTAALVGVAANLITAALVELIPAWKETAELYEESVKLLLSPEDPVRRAVGIFAVVVMAPVCEEILFRGTILPAQQNAKGTSVAVLIVVNGLLFAMLHLNHLTFVALWCVGAFFAHLVVLTRSIWPAIFAHAVLNGVNGVAAPMLLADHIDPAADPSLSELAVAASIVLPAVAALWYFGARRLQRDLANP